jgi:fimbrial isopeptide formation D2 family protein/LPXTG-motif cell wall-anchored protein
MKTMKKLLALVLGLVMALALCVTAFAAEGDHTITINNTDSSVKHTYQAYQILKGKVENGQLTKIEWGAGVDGPALLAELKAANNPFNDIFIIEDAQNAVDVARILATFENDGAMLDAFALAAGKHLTSTVAGTSTETASPYTINVNGDGYYFVKDKDGTVTATGESYSKYMLKVVTDTTIEAKDDHLVPEKKIVDGENRLDVDSLAIGDVVTFEIKIPVPKMDGYANYFFQMNDVMCAGLTFQEIVSVKVGSKDVYDVADTTRPTEDALADQTYSYTTQTGADGKTTLNLTYNKFIQYKGETGFVVVTYKAVLNEKADLVAANPNTVKYTYSNDPSQSGIPTWQNIVGVTPEDTVEVYATKLQILKKGDDGRVLAGAEFKLEGTALNRVLVSGTKFEKTPYTPAANETIETAGDPAANVIYYLLKNGTYTTTAPVDGTAAQYQSTTDTYYKVSFTDKEILTGETVDAIVTTGDDGIAVFAGLNEGTYTLTETKAPAGYNAIAPITFTIEWDGTNKVFKMAEGDNSGVTYDAANHQFVVTVINQSGSVLPSTGGIGTTIFYILGAVLAIGAGVVLVTRRRMGEEQ